jgi:hypothetical protein
MLRRSLLCGLVVSAFACETDRAGKREVDSNVDSKPAPASCEDQTKIMAQRLVERCDRPKQGFVNLPGPPAPPTLTMPTSMFPTVHIEVQSDHYYMHGLSPHDVDERLSAFELASLADLYFQWDERLDALRFASERRGQPEPEVGWSLSAPPELPAKRVLEVASYLAKHGGKAGMDGAFIFRGADIPKYEPPDPSYATYLRKLLAEAPDEQASMVAAEEAKTLTAACLPIQETFVRAAALGDDERCDFLARSVSEALAACNCSIAPAKLETFLAENSLAPEFWSIPAHVRVTESGERIEYDDTTTWGDFLTTLQGMSSDPSRTRELWFVPVASP